MQQQIEKNADKLAMNGKKSLNEVRDTLSNIDVQHGVEVATDKLKEYGTVAYKVAKKNPVYVALGAAGIGLILGGLFVSSLRKER
jgi:ElaB/YqjD/DUF883 family membrane-anchored ribosome-binding protein